MTKTISRYIKSSTNSFHLAFLPMIDRQYLLMFITKNRQETTLLSPNHEAEVPLKSEADVLSRE